jgi:cytochrome c oxidase subunit 3
MTEVRKVTADDPGDHNGVTSALALDVRHLPSFGFGHRSLMWWSTVCLMLIEGTVSAIAAMMYFYLRSLTTNWPLNAAPPAPLWGSANTAVLLLSMWPNQLAKRAADREDRARSRLWLSVCLLFAFVFPVLRGFEFAALNVNWHTNAYGSVVWLCSACTRPTSSPTTVDTAVLAVLLFAGPFVGKRFVDVSENALYWYFVVLSWLPIYAVIYLAPRL